MLQPLPACLVADIRRIEDGHEHTCIDDTHRSRRCSWTASRALLLVFHAVPTRSATRSIRSSAATIAACSARDRTARSRFSFKRSGRADRGDWRTTSCPPTFTRVMYLPVIDEYLCRVTGRLLIAAIDGRCPRPLDAVVFRAMYFSRAIPTHQYTGAGQTSDSRSSARVTARFDAMRPYVSIKIISEVRLPLFRRHWPEAAPLGGPSAGGS